jgi:hypothetical protein
VHRLVSQDTALDDTFRFAREFSPYSLVALGIVILTSISAYS